MNHAIFSTAGRLTRRDYALTIAALCGGASLLTFAAISLLLPLTYVTATLFFREMALMFWILFFMGGALILASAAILLPLLAIPATVRRLHDIGRGSWLAFPLVLLSLIAFGLPVFFLFIFAALLEGINQSGSMVFFDSPEQLELILGSFVLGYFILCFVTLFIMSVYGAWIFLKKGMSTANCYGDVPAEEQIPSVRAAYFSGQGTIDRAHFVFRTLIVIAAAGVIVPTLGQSVLYPAAAILKSLGAAPMGTDFFALLIGGMIYPLAALPLVLRRLRTLGRSRYEALVVFAALLPNLLSAAATARFLGSLDRLTEDAIGDAIIEEFITIGTANDSLFIALWLLCALLSLIGVVRLLRADEENAEANAMA